MKYRYTLFVLCMLAPFAIFGQISEEHIITDPILEGPRVMHSVDLDGDGFDDLVAAGASTLVWWRNTGMDSFTDMDTIATGVAETTSIYSADFDGDTDQDIVLCYNIRSYDCSALGLSQGNTTSREASIPPAPPPPAEGFLAWIENLGNGEFAQRVLLDDSLTYARSVYVADLDGDEDDDILLGTIGGWGLCFGEMGTAAWYENLGGGSFGERTPLVADSVDVDVYTIRAVDFDGDLDNDVFANHDINGQIVYFENLGSGSFGPQQVFSGSLPINCSAMEFGDLNGDQRADMVVGNDYELIWVDNQTGFGIGAVQMLDTLVGNIGIHLSDLDDDQDVDVLAVLPQAGQIKGYFNLGMGIFGFSEVIDSSANGPIQVITTDADGGGQRDPVVLSSYDQEIAWYKNYGWWQFGPQRIITPDVYQPVSIVAADMDGDMDADIIVSSRGSSKLTLFENVGSNTFSDPIFIDTYVYQIGKVSVADIDDDGDKDIMLLGALSDDVTWYENQGNNTFGPRQPIISSPSYVVYDAVAEDMNGDGLVDVVATYYNGGSVHWFENLGNGVFGQDILLGDSLNKPCGLSVSDLDGDGDKDVSVASRNDHEVVWFENLGGVTFAGSAHPVGTLHYVTTVFSADIDLDNDSDLVAAGDGGISWFENLGNGTFDVPVVIDSSMVSSIFVSDILGGSSPDVLVSNNGPRLLLNSPSLLFDSIYPFAVDAGSDYNSALFAADMEEDSDNDIFLASYARSTVSWFENLSVNVGVEEDEYPQISIYPNPTTGVLILKLSEPTQLNVYDAVGRLVISKRCNVLAQIHLEDEPNGIYFLNFATGQGTLSYKVVKMD